MLHLLSTFRSMPWALEPSVMALVCGIVDRWASGARLSAEDIAAAIGDSPEAAARRADQSRAMSGGGVAVMPVYGVLAHRAYSVANTSRPLTSTEALAATFRAAVADPDVGTIVLDVDSPGGSVFGVQEFADTIAAARGQKRIVAVANSTAASGAYWIASQADQIVVTPSGMVGSIGVIVPHTDLSEAYAKEGIKRSYITYGRYKAEGNDAGPLDDEARTHLQSLVDTYGAAFTRAVAKGRGLPVETVRGPAFGEGRMRLAREAVAAGMADAEGTLEEVVAREARTAKRKPAGMSAHTARRHIETLQT